MPERCADSCLQPDIDILILDYNIYHALSSILNIATIDSGKNENDARSNSPSTRVLECLSIVDNLVNLFNSHHFDLQLDHADVSFRLELLRFSTLFIFRDNNIRTRITPQRRDIKALRRHFELEARHYKPFEECDSLVSTSRVLEVSLANVENVQKSKDIKVDFFDLLPLFLNISAVRFIDAEHEGGPSRKWMEVAAEFMLWATFDFLDRERQGKGILDVKNTLEPFRLGYLDEKSHHHHPYKILFLDDSRQEEWEGWRSIRDEYLSKLSPPRGVQLSQHILNLRHKQVMTNFDHVVVGFLKSLCASIQKPVLVELDSGKLSGLSRTETELLKQRVGWYGGLSETRRPKKQPIF